MQSAPVTVEIEIPAVDDPPIAEDDEYHFGSAGSIDVPAPGVLGNDFDEVEGDSLTCDPSQPAAQGDPGTGVRTARSPTSAIPDRLGQ